MYCFLVIGTLRLSSLPQSAHESTSTNVPSGNSIVASPPRIPANYLPLPSFAFSTLSRNRTQSCKALLRFFRYE